MAGANWLMYTARIAHAKSPKINRISSTKITPASRRRLCLIGERRDCFNVVPM